MPYDDPDPHDPMELVGVSLPADAGSTREMACVFADEFARMGYDRERILRIFRQPHYAGAHAAWRRLGEEEILNIISESVAVWGRIHGKSRSPETADGHGPMEGPNHE